MSGAGGGAGYEWWMAPLARGVWGGPKKIVLFKMSVEAILMRFEAFFFLSYQAYFTSISCISDANDSFLNPPPAMY